MSSARDAIAASTANPIRPDTKNRGRGFNIPALVHRATIFDFNTATNFRQCSFRRENKTPSLGGLLISPGIRMLPSRGNAFGWLIAFLVRALPNTDLEYRVRPFRLKASRLRSRKGQGSPLWSILSITVMLTCLSGGGPRLTFNESGIRSRMSGRSGFREIGSPWTVRERAPLYGEGSASEGGVSRFAVPFEQPRLCISRGPPRRASAVSTGSLPEAPWELIFLPSSLPSRARMAKCGEGRPWAGAK